jgi:pimeloyl-ACP methyl ester carboxylesterase
MTTRTTDHIIAEWAGRGRRLEVTGAGTTVWHEGSGEPVVCLHGVPSSTFLYRKVLAQLADRGLRGIAFDLPGLGLADRPKDFDYSWSGLGAWTRAAVESLGLDRFHLIVHDIGGPIGFDLVARVPDRIASLTVLNTMVRVATFKRPWSMEPFARRGIGELASCAGPARTPCTSTSAPTSSPSWAPPPRSPRTAPPSAGCTSAAPAPRPSAGSAAAQGAPPPAPCWPTEASAVAPGESSAARAGHIRNATTRNGVGTDRVQAEPSITLRTSRQQRTAERVNPQAEPFPGAGARSS